MSLSQEAEAVVRNQARSPWIAIIGVDGTGKTSVLNQIEQSLPSLPFTSMEVLHRRPRIAYQNKVDQPGKIAHYQKPPHSALVSTIKLGVMLLDWQLGYWRRIKRQRASGALVVADRHSLLDLLADPLRYRYGGPARLIRFAVRLAPMPDLIILLDAPLEVLQKRKREVPIENLRVMRDKYLEMSRWLPNCVVIDASQPLAVVVADVKRFILRACDLPP